MSLKAQQDVAATAFGEGDRLDSPAVRKLAERSPELAKALDKLRAHRQGAKRLNPLALFKLIQTILGLIAELMAK